MATAKVSDEIVDEGEIQVAPRGRKAEYDEDLVALFGRVTEGKAVVLRNKFGVTPTAERNKVSTTIRKNWAEAMRRAGNFAHDGSPRGCRINYGTEGVPQVKFAPATVGAEADDAEG